MPSSSHTEPDPDALCTTLSHSHKPDPSSLELTSYINDDAVVLSEEKGKLIITADICTVPIFIISYFTNNKNRCNLTFCFLLYTLTSESKM